MTVRHLAANAAWTLLCRPSCVTHAASSCAHLRTLPCFYHVCALPRTPSRLSRTAPLPAHGATSGQATGHRRMSEGGEGSKEEIRRGAQGMLGLGAYENILLSCRRDESLKPFGRLSYGNVALDGNRADVALLAARYRIRARSKGEKKEGRKCATPRALRLEWSALSIAAFLRPYACGGAARSAA